MDLEPFPSYYYYFNLLERESTSTNWLVAATMYHFEKGVPIAIELPAHANRESAGSTVEQWQETHVRCSPKSGQRNV
jgi:hypothetical protein